MRLPWQSLTGNANVVFNGPIVDGLSTANNTLSFANSLIPLWDGSNLHIGNYTLSASNSYGAHLGGHNWHDDP